MPNKLSPIGEHKKIALIAHDNKKADLLEWVKTNKKILLRHELFATETTGRILEKELDCKITKLQSGPLGGDQQIGARITEGIINFLIFFWDPLSPLSHDPDIKALLRVAAVWNIPIACNQSSADFLISSPLMSQKYPRTLPDYESYKNRALKKSLQVI